MLARISSNHIAICVAIIGIALLFLLQQNLEPKEMKIGEIKKSGSGLFVEIKGRASLASESEKALFFELSDGNSILAVKFNPSIQERALLREKKFVLVQGKTWFYGKKLEIIVEKVEEWISR